MKFKAAVLTKCNSPLEIMELTPPPLNQGQVLVKIKYSGICRSQLNEVKGLKGPDRFLPHTLGHEGAGTVVETGPGVSKVKNGQNVILTWIKGEGMDAGGVIYESNGSKINSGPISTFMEYAVISENRLIPIDPHIPLKEASLFGCAIPTGAGIIYNEMQLKPTSSIALFGMGGIGLSALLAASSKQAKQIIAIDLEPQKLALAKKLGATHTLLFDAHLEKNLLDITNGTGVDFSVEAVGKKNVMEYAFRAVKPASGLCVLAGNVPKEVKIECDPFDFIRGKRLIGTWGGRVVPDRDIPLFIQEFFQDPKDLTSLISHEAPLTEINAMLTLLDQGKVARTLVTFE